MKAYQEFFEHYFNIQGRTGRPSYWAVTALNLLFLAAFYLVFKFLFMILNMVDGLLLLDLLVAFITIVVVVLLTFFVLAILIPSVTISVRRYRDTGLPNAFLLVLPALFLAICWCLSEFISDGYLSIWAVLVTGFFLLADILIKLLPSATE
ncbi:DUF805 domain-containing protein [Fructobacillus sp. M158]|uniref:DUF805 domain-containing protein n=1 Tax=Fructobacillus parabroussonetiae TaxID=2713174 RepID=UPI00200A53D8|nr:DUF805 domain-containing protein [Fructobacillus parabroussonetiae]MCK8617351.1 DUF805 domain-containing protein [Fructobacillus parabroussonetiae]